MHFLRMMLCGILLTSAVFAVLSSIYTYEKKDNIKKYFSYLSLCISFYSLGYAMEFYSDSLDRMLFWNLVQYIGIPFLPAFWILFAFEYNGKKLDVLSRMGTLFIPCLTMFFRFTSSVNHLYYSNVQIAFNNYFPVLFIQKGPWYWVQFIFATSCFVVANYLFLLMYRKSNGSIRRQTLFLLIASLLPWISLLLNLLNLSPLTIDYGPFAITSSLIIFFMSFFRYQFLNIKPLARDKVFDSTANGLIVLDLNYCIIDYNPAATLIFADLNETAIGKDVRRALNEYEGLVDSIVHNQESQFVMKPKGHYKVNTVKIVDKNHEIGYVVSLTDVTKYMDLVEELNYLASKDALTGVFNRRYFVELGSLELEKSKRYRRPLSLIILDLDYFKQINDNYGHQAGDAVLQAVASICRSSLRLTDILGRYGGEEFVILLPETSLDECRMISNRILDNIAEAETVYEGKEITVTASLGVTGVDCVTVESLDYFLKYADEALYRAKSEGRNCVRSLAS
ncbi:diguanylate cyclase [Heliobacterium gestii]|uniref:Diguanylate cyclase n=1 Tax=Heliomicrobium gestii TaxID=2699 RepID=A0A845LKR1_HELGE|nr:histidine kinase N-terminal 7TM domain-containing protein [Heliomicrobium gestii]MBM7867468.1 diguanylate cyclase (GGDEF)-like protein [Heliomicrobium gestii]MZP43983.1 diguanylate cyclase [Heliomicrobium gestii]